MIPPDTHLQIGSLLFEGLDQIDPHRTVRSAVAYSQLDISALRQDRRGRSRRERSASDAGAALANAPQLDVLHVPGGLVKKP